MVKLPGNEHPHEWYIWTVRPGKFDIVKAYIEKNVREVTDILCPTVTSEKQTKTGLKKVKVSPLYAGYVFMQYTHDIDDPVAWVKINNHPFVVSYVGPCSAKDIALIAK
jgi:transcription antitermination factor NusG